MESFDPDQDDSSEYFGTDDDSLPIRQRDDDEVIAVLASITDALPSGGEVRPGQREMALAVARAVRERRHLVVEAGTGVGKSLAYLTPVALSGSRVVVVTATKNLQDQLATKDVPQVQAFVPGLKVAVLKGRNNYFCRQRGRDIGVSTQLSFDDDAELPTSMVDQIRHVVEWAKTSPTGERDELPFDVQDRAWRQVSVDASGCPGKLICPSGNECFTERAREAAAAADVVVVNTALYVAHLGSGKVVLPQHDFVVFDEAHELEDICARNLGVTLNLSQLRAVATQLRSRLAKSDADDLDAFNKQIDQLAATLRADFEENRLDGISEAVSEALESIGAVLKNFLVALKTIEAASTTTVKSMTLRPTLEKIIDTISEFSGHDDEQILYLSREGRDVTINLSYVRVGSFLAEHLWSETTGILTSATIPDHLAVNLGLPASETDQLEVASPFDYKEHSLLYVAKHLPDRVDEDEYVPKMLDELVALITAAGGRTLALFTNRRFMERVVEEIEPRLATRVLQQDDLPKNLLLQEFRDDETSSLFAVASFWQGIDVPGNSLSLVTIDRLPFQTPNDPIGKARRDRAGERGFIEVDLPRATMLLAQGVGRLIRSTTDRGVVAVFDNRLATKNYRHPILKKLPPMKRTTDLDEVTAFLRALHD